MTTNKKHDNSVEDVYIIKNFMYPKIRGLETIFEEPKNEENGSQVMSLKRYKRFIDFDCFITKAKKKLRKRKVKRLECHQLPKKRKQSKDSVDCLESKLTKLDEELSNTQENVSDIYLGFDSENELETKNCDSLSPAMDLPGSPEVSSKFCMQISVPSYVPVQSAVEILNLDQSDISRVSDVLQKVVISNLDESELTKILIASRYKEFTLCEKKLLDKQNVSKEDNG